MSDWLKFQIAYIPKKCAHDSHFIKRYYHNPDSKVHGANMGPMWGRQYPMDVAIWGADEPTNDGGTDGLPTSRCPLNMFFFNGCNAILIAIHMTPWLQWNQHGGCRCPGAYLAPGHLQLSWWRMPVHVYHGCIGNVVRLCCGFIPIDHQSMCPANEK